MQDIISYLEKKGKPEFAHRISTVVEVLDGFLGGKSFGTLVSEREESQDQIEHLTKKSHALAHELTLLQQRVVELMTRVKTLEDKPAVAVYGTPRADAIGRPFSEELFNPVKGVSLQVPMHGASFSTYGRSVYDPEPLPHEHGSE